MGEAITSMYEGNRPRWESALVEKTRREKRYVKCLLRSLLPKRPGRRSDVTVVGPMALFWYQVEHNAGPIWEDDPEQVNILVSGRAGSSSFLFEKFINSCRKKLDAFGDPIDWDRKFIHQSFLSSGVGLENWHVELRFFPKVLIFIRNPEGGSAREFLNHCPVNVGRIAYNIYCGRYEVESSVADDINHCRTRIECQVCFRNNGCPSDLELDRIEDCMSCMKRYALRGFKFVNGEGVVCT